MAKKSKLATPTWILEGYDSPAEYEKAKGISNEDSEGKIEKVKIKKEKTKSKNSTGKIFKVKKCPQCGSYDVGIVLSNSDTEEESNTGREWECRECKWRGSNIDEFEMDEEEFMKYLDSKGEEVA